MSQFFSRRSFLKIGTAGIIGTLSVSVESVLAQTSAIQNQKKVLVAYFSHTGNTEFVAKKIQGMLSADILEIKTVERYPEEHGPCSEIAGRQLKANYRPKLQPIPLNPENYDIIFLGYPIWWHTMPMACWAFLESYDFAGKIVAPFCTHAGAGLANSIRDIQKLIPDSTLLTGFQTTDARSDRLQKDLSDWIEKLGYLF